MVMGEVSVSAKGGDFALVVRQADFEGLGLDSNAGYELFRASDGIWVLVKKQKKPVQENPLDARIFSLLREKDLNERVEKRFEKFLNKEETARFRELLKEGRIVAFRLSQKYQRAVYKTREEIEKNIKVSRQKGSGQPKAVQAERAAEGNAAEGISEGRGAEGAGEKAGAEKESESFDADEKRVDEYSLQKDGFLVFKNSENAKILSVKLKEDIEGGKIQGIKGFDGFYYIAESNLYLKHRAGVLDAIKSEKGILLEKIAEKAGISKMLAKVVCEFLKDEGEVIEKRKESFQAI